MGCSVNWPVVPGTLPPGFGVVGRADADPDALNAGTPPLPDVVATIDGVVAEVGARPVVLTALSVLVRYGHLETVAHGSDFAT